MRVMVMVRATQESEEGAMPPAELLEAMTRYNEELAAAGVLVAAEGLHPTAKGKRVVIDGPFPAREGIAGYWLWEVESLEAAVAWARRCPNPMASGGALEIRPLFEAADFGEALSPDVAAREERLREDLAAR